jgi:hypothetical protein
VQLQVPQHHAGRQQQRSGVGDALPRNLLAHVPRTLLKHRNVCANVATWHNAIATTQACGSKQNSSKLLMTCIAQTPRCEENNVCANAIATTSVLRGSKHLKNSLS